MPGTTLLLDDAAVLRPGELVVPLRQTRVAEWALALTLLIERLCDKLTLVSPDSVKMQVSVAPEAGPHRSRITRSHQTLYLTLARNDAEAFQAMLLRAYRDGMAEVNHLHVEADSESGEFDVTWMFDTARPPITGEEATRRINED